MIYILRALETEVFVTTWTNQQRIEFAVRFAFENLDFYREGDWLNLNEDIRSFIGVYRTGELSKDILKLGVFMPMENPDPSRDELRLLQRDMRQILNFATGAPGSTEIKLAYVIVRGPGMNIPYIQRSGTFRDCALGLLIRLLELESTSSVVRCPAPKCNKVFYRRGKQMFCSRTCTNRAMVNRKRDRDRQAEEARRKKTRKSSRQRKAVR